MSTAKVNTIEPASGGTVTITGAALTTPALGTPASGTLTNCTGFPAGNLAGTTLPSAVVNASLNAITASGGTLTTTGAQTNIGNFKCGANANDVSISEPFMAAKNDAGPVYGFVRNNSSSASAYAGLAINAEGNSWGWRMGSTAANSNGWEIAVDALGSPVAKLKQDTSGNLLPGSDNAQTFGSGSFRWSTIYAGTGTINTSDARDKTPVTKLTAAEISAARALAKEIGTFQFLNGRRTHVGMTVQRAIEIMQAWGLDPFKYALICHDSWDAQVIEHGAVEAVEAQAAIPAQYETRTAVERVLIDGQPAEIRRTYQHEVSPAVPAVEAVEAQPARTEVIREAGDRYGFRYDQLMMFIAAGVLAQ